MKLPKGYSEELIDQYLSGKLEGSILKELELAIASDPELKSYVAAQKRLLAEIEQYGKRQLQKQIKAEAQQLKSEGFFIEDSTIDDYLMGYLSPQETKSLEQLAQKQAELRNRINTQRSLIEKIDALGTHQLLDNIKEVQEELQSEGFFKEEKDPNSVEVKQLLKVAKTTAQQSNKSRILLYRWSTTAAIITLFFLATRFLIWPIFSSNQDFPLLALHEELSKEVESELSEQGFAAKKDQSLVGLQRALLAYNSSNYAEAILDFKQYIHDRPMADQTPQVQLYLAISYLAEKKTKDALPILLGLKQSPPSIQEKLAIDWYLAKAYWDSGQKRNAKKLLEELAQQESPYKKSAQQLLE